MGEGGFGTMKISACVMVKNEEKNLPRWIQSMQGLADEMIVVDTGSTDRTVEIAQKAGAKVFHMPWQNDFATPKNYAIDQAQGDWIIFLDADEYFLPASKEKVLKVLQEIEAKNSRINAVVCKLINVDADHHYRIQGGIHQLRIFKRSLKMRYQGKIHEHLVDKDAAMHEVYATDDIVIYHTGYSTNIARKKLERNLQFLKQREKENDGKENPDDVLHYMDCYYGIQDYDKAEHYARLAIDRHMRAQGRAGTEYETLYSIYMITKKSVQECQSLLDEAMNAYPDEPDFPIYRGLLYWEKKEYLEAAYWFQRGISLSKGRKSIGSDGAVRMVPMAKRFLARIEEMRGHKKQAQRIYLESLRKNPYDGETLRGYVRTLDNISAEDLIVRLNSIYDKNTDADFLTEELRKLPPTPVLAYYAHRLPKNENVNAAAAYTGAGHFDAASVLLSAGLGAFEKIHVEAQLAQKKGPKDDSTAFIFPDTLAQSWHARSLPRVSILIPTYNRPVYFEQTLQSALRQDWPNLEIIVTDNSTNDQTEQCIEKYLGDRRLTYVRNAEAKTKADNFRSMEKLATGEYIQWCMDDDILLDGKITLMMKALLTDSKIKLATSRRGFIDEHGNPLPDQYTSVPNNGKEYSIWEGERAARATLMGVTNFLGEPSAFLYRRQDLDFPYWDAEADGYLTISDVRMQLNLLEKGDCIYFQHPLSCTRQHAEQEGKQEDVILLSRQEWLRLLLSYWERKVFLHTLKDLEQPLKALYLEYHKNVLAGRHIGSPKAWKAYAKDMERAGKLLEEMTQNERV